MRMIVIKQATDLLQISSRLPARAARQRADHPEDLNPHLAGVKKIEAGAVICARFPASRPPRATRWKATRRRSRQAQLQTGQPASDQVQRGWSALIAEEKDVSAAFAPHGGEARWRRGRCPQGADRCRHAAVQAGSDQREKRRRFAERDGNRSGGRARGDREAHALARFRIARNAKGLGIRVGVRNHKCSNQTTAVALHEQIDEARAMKATLATICAFTAVAGCWLRVMELLLGHSGFQQRMIGAALIAAQSILTLLVVAGSAGRVGRVGVSAGACGILALGVMVMLQNLTDLTSRDSPSSSARRWPCRPCLHPVDHPARCNGHASRRRSRGPPADGAC